MDIFNVQSLITKKRIVTANDIDPTSSYLQVGVFQPGNKPSNSGNADAYPSYAIPISEISTKSLKNVIVVDGTYGDDTTAVAAGIYDFNKPFARIDAAIANASYGDTLWVLGNYQAVTEQLLNLNLTIYAWNCVLEFGQQIATAGDALLTIRGNSTILIGKLIDTSLADYTIIDIECTEVITMDFSAYFYLDNNGSFNKISEFRLRARYIETSSVVFILAGLNYNINIDSIRFDAYAQSSNIGIIWTTLLTNAATIKTGSNYNLGNVTYNAINGSSLIKMVGGTPDQKFFVTGNYTASLDADPTAPTAIVEHDTSKCFVDINATMDLRSVGVYATRGDSSQAIIRGNIKHVTLGSSNKYACCYYISLGKVKFSADTISPSKVIIFIENSGQIDITNCKLINGVGYIMSIISATARIENAKFIGSIGSITTATPQTIEVISLYTNLAPVPGITNSIPLVTPGIVVEAGLTDIGF